MISKLVEFERRRPGATGFPVILADGCSWLLASPVFQSRFEGLTRPNIDQPLDSVFESAIRGEALELEALFEITGKLLLANYDLMADEVESLLEVAPGAASRVFFDGVISALFGAKLGGKSYTHWVRASLLANGLGTQDIPAGDLLDVMSILVATNRTISLTKFADACREFDERARLETLI